MNKKILFIFCICFRASLAQTDSSQNFNLSGYAEAYFATDINKNAFVRLPAYYYSHTSLQKPDINLAFIKAAYSNRRIRANVAMAAGSYAKENIGRYVDLFEANAGLKLSPNQNLWLDAGLLPSHIGFESAVSADCPTLSRSLMAENSPYYESGAKLTWNDTHWLASLLYINGWQNFKQWQAPAIGFQVNYKPYAATVVNYSAYLGKGNFAAAQRTYHNFYVTFSPPRGLHVILGLDLGQDRSRLKNTATWWTPVVIARLPVGSQNSFALRGEYFHDPISTVLQVFSSGGTPLSSVKTVSFNYDRKLLGKLWFRNEIKGLSGKDLSHGWIFLSSLAIKIG